MQVEAEGRALETKRIVVFRPPAYAGGYVAASVRTWILIRMRGDWVKMHPVSPSLHYSHGVSHRLLLRYRDENN